VTSVRILFVAALAMLGVSCRISPPPAIDPAIAASIPPGATILAGINPDRVRASAVYRQLPPAASGFLQALGPARSVLVAFDGVRYLVLARGDFRETPSGATLLGKGLAGMGSPDWLESARHGGAGNGRNALLARAAPIAASADIWMAAAGSANLPVSGNGENLNNLLHATEYATLSVRLTDNVALEIVGLCRGPEPARHLEETVRAFASIGAGATARQPAISGLLRRIQVTRDGSAVHVNLTAEAAELQTVLKLLGIGS
jgi:hypothetical protein